MSNQKNATAKNAKSKNETLTVINLQKYATALKERPTEAIRQDRKLLYKYPETFSKSDVNGEKGKKFRSNLRNKLERFDSNLYAYIKKDELENLKKEVKEFISFYEENYLINDFSITSLSAKSDVQTKYADMMQIVKDFK